MRIVVLVLLIVGMNVAPLAKAQNAIPTEGLLITRVNSEQWQIRLIANTSAQQFSGVVESDRPITAARGLDGQSTENAKLLAPTSLGALLTAHAGGVEGLCFSASPDAKLCLRDAGSPGVHMYLGGSLAEAVPVAAPVALTAPRCLWRCERSGIGGSSRKYHPGPLHGHGPE